jgi:N utilization substance protein B
MGGKRTKGREYAMLALFAHFVGEGESEDALEMLCESRNPSSEVRDFATEILQGVLQNIDFIDESICKHLDPKWEFERIANLEKVILRQALYEFFFTPTPVNVIVSEALSLIDDYSVDSSIGFINGVLGALFARLERPEFAEETGYYVDDSDFEEIEEDDEDFFPVPENTGGEE